jgi:hypothetical protein
MKMSGFLSNLVIHLQYCGGTAGIENGVDKGFSLISLKITTIVTTFSFW